jgi:hypothetical protein
MSKKLKYKVQVNDDMMNDMNDMDINLTRTYNKDKIRDDMFSKTSKKDRSYVSKDIKLNKIKFDEIDLLVAKFAWESYQLFRTKKLDKEDVKRIEELLDDYRIYTQTHINPSSYSNYSMTPQSQSQKSVTFFTPDEKEERKEAQEILDKLDLITSSIKGLGKIPVLYKDGNAMVDKDKIYQHFDFLLQEEKEEDLFRMSLSSDYQYDMDQKEKDKIIQKLQSDIDKQKHQLSKKELEEARKLLMGDRKEDLYSRDLMLQEIKYNQDQQMRVLYDALSSIKEQSGSAQNELLGARLDNVEKLTEKMANNILELHSEMVRNQDLSSVSWQNLPQQIRLLWAKGLWSFAIKATTLPITAPAFLVNNILIKPALYSTKILFEKLYFLWGIVAIYIIIGNVGHIYISNEEYINEKFSQFFSSDNIIINAAQNYVIYPSKTIVESRASREELYEVWSRIANIILGSFGTGLWASWEKIRDFTYDYVGKFVTESIKRYIPFSSWW